MNIKKMSNEELEKLSHMDIAYNILKFENKQLNTVDLLKEIVDETELIRGKRGEEIKLYIPKHPNIDNFVILDDEIFEDYDDYLLKHLVKTSFYIDGLTEEHIEQAKIILNKKDIKTKKYDN